MKRVLFFSVILFLAYFSIQLLTLGDYGRNWDDTKRYSRGQAYLNFFLTGEKDYKNLKTPRKSKYLSIGSLYTFDYFAKYNPIGHPPVSDIFSSAFNLIFFENLGIVGDIESYHLFLIFMSAVLVAYLFYTVATEYNLFAGFVTAISLAVYPLFWSESHFNFKDPPETVFFSLTLLTFYKAVIKESWRWLLFSSFLAGFAMGTKFNIFVAGLIMVPWYVISHWEDIKKFHFRYTKKFLIALGLYPIIAFSILYLSWPFLWSNPVNNLIKVFQYYSFWGYTADFIPERYITIGGINTYAVQWILYTTPLIILFLSFAGIIFLFKNLKEERKKISLLTFLWLIISIGRVTLPKGNVTNGVREIMEYIPAMAILCGVGAYSLIGVCQKLFANTQFAKIGGKIIIILLFAPIILKLISIHPNENVYFNPIIGGLRGAQKNNLYFWGNSFGNTYRQAANWLNVHAEKNARVDLAVASESELPKEWLRKDIIVSNAFRKDFLRKNGEYIVEVTSDWPVWPQFCYWAYAKIFLKPLYEVKVDGISILAIWKNDTVHANSGFSGGNKLSLLDTCINREVEPSAAPPPFGIPGQYE